MSTAFRFNTVEDRASDEGQWAFTRWCGTSRAGVDSGEFDTCAAFDFGSMQNMVNVEQRMMAGERVFAEDSGEEMTVTEMVTVHHRFSFGEFGGTVAVGSGEMMDRMGETRMEG